MSTGANEAYVDARSIGRRSVLPALRGSVRESFSRARSNDTKAREGKRRHYARKTSLYSLRASQEAERVGAQALESVLYLVCKLKAVGLIARKKSCKHIRNDHVQNCFRREA